MGFAAEIPKRRETGAGGGLKDRINSWLPAEVK
jgi:hypothetical protein